MPSFLVAATYESRRSGSDTLLNLFLHSERPADPEDADDVARRLANGEELPEGWSVISIEWRHPEGGVSSWRSSSAPGDWQEFGEVVRSSDLRVSELDDDADLFAEDEEQFELLMQRARRRAERDYHERIDTDEARERRRRRKPAKRREKGRE